MPSDCCLSYSHSQVFKFSSNLISEPFSWLVLNRSHKTCLALQCIRPVVCSTNFFHKNKFVFANPLLKSRKKYLSRKFLKLIIIIVIVFTVHLFTADKKGFHIILKKAI